METTEEEQDASEQTTEPDASKKKNTSATAPAKKEVPSVTPVSEKSAYQDGTYTGTGTGFAGPITVQVIIKGGKIAEITVLSTSDDSPYIDNAKALLKNIVAVQSTNVDTVSGATYSSVGLISAVAAILGHYIGAGLAIKNGSKIVKPTVILVLLLLTVKVGSELLFPEFWN